MPCKGRGRQKLLFDLSVKRIDFLLNVERYLNYFQDKDVCHIQKGCGVQIVYFFAQKQIMLCFFLL